MSLTKVFIPFRAYWTTPFCRWQGSFGGIHSMKLAAKVAAKTLAEKEIAPETLDGLVLGMTIPQRHAFYGAPWFAAMIGAPSITGATIGQACATSARVLAYAALEVEVGQRVCILGVTCDRTSNGPHLYYPNPAAPGGKGDAEDWVWDNFSFDPHAKNAMIETAERVATEVGITTEEQNQVTLLRYQQYLDAVADDRAFQSRYMVTVDVPKGRKKTIPVAQDEGIFPTTVEGLSKLRPVKEGGSVTFGTQTFPADGNAGIVVSNSDVAKRLSADPNVTIQVISYGEARTKKGMMPMAVVPAAKDALQRAGIGIDSVKAVKTHNPFAVNDVFFCREMNLEFDAINNYGSPLIFGHPQGPTGTRLVIELIEELVEKGGGYGLFSGCAAGDTAMACVLKVS